jgi:tetratricopeptide (TPR) repeat protein
MIDRKPAADITEAIANFDRKGQLAEALGSSGRRMSSGGSSQMIDTVTQYYRNLADLLEALGSPLNRTAPSVYPVTLTGSFSPSPEFRAFAAALHKEFEQARQAAQAAETEREKRLQAENIGREEAEARRREKALRDVFHREALGVHDVKALLALVDQLPTLVPPADGPSPDRQMAINGEMERLRSELRRMAAWWLSGGASQYTSGGAWNQAETEFPVEMKLLRDQAMRDMIATRYEAPQLREPPASEMELEAAVLALARKSGEAGDWKRALALLGSLGSSSLDGSAQMRQNAIRSFLAGENFERAEQFPQAIRAYQSVLEEVCDFSPVNEAIERLKALRKAHPEIFERWEAAGVLHP